MSLPASRRKRRARHRRQKEYLHCYVRISEWDHYYSFSAADRRAFQMDPHLETLSFRGSMVSPEQFKYPQAVITLSAKRNLQDVSKNGGNENVGFLDAGGDTVHVNVFVPVEHMP